MQDKKKFPPLQAADTVAYEGWKQWAREYGGDNRPTRYPFKRLSEKIPSEWATLKPMTLPELWAQNGGPSMPAWLMATMDFLVGRAPAAPLTLPRWW